MHPPRLFLLNITVYLRCIAFIKHSSVTLHCCQMEKIEKHRIICWMCGFPCSRSRCIVARDSTFPVAECSATRWTERRFVLLYDARELFYYITQETARRQMKTNATISPSLALSFSSSIFVSLFCFSPNAIHCQGCCSNSTPGIAMLTKIL